MNCIINSNIDKYVKKGKKLEVIRRYIMVKYRINIDLTSLKERIKLLKGNYEYQS